MKGLLASLLFTVFLGLPMLHAQNQGATFYLRDTLPVSTDVASNPSVLIDGWWKYHPDDHVFSTDQWTSPDFNDSTWEETLSRLPVDSLPKGGWKGSGLFRLYLRIDSSLWQKPLAINVIQKGASEIYLDGILLNKYGIVGGTETPETGVNTLTTPPGYVVFSQASHVISVRFSSISLLHHRPPGITDLGFVLSIGNAATTMQQSLNNLKFFRTIEILAIAIPLTFSLLHLILFLFAGRIQSNLYFALFTSVIALWGILEHESFFTVELHTALTLKRLWPVYAALAPLAMLRFLYALFYTKVPKQFWFFSIVGFLLAIAAWFTHKGVSVLIALLFILYIFEMLRVVIVAIRTKKQGARIIGFGFISFGFSLLVLIITAIVFHTFTVQFFYGMLYLVGVLGILISMSLHLSLSISSMNKNLETQTLKSRSLELDNARKEVELEKAAELKQAYQALEESHTKLKGTQAQLIQAEKMASLGELTAGIAHEIQNPLNFVNNFAEVSHELIDEMKDGLDKGHLDEAKSIATDLQQNLEKITFHGKRADAIVKGMLQHSRASSGVKEPTDINALADEYLRLAYHGLRAKDKSFNATIKTDFDKTIGKIDVIPQDIGRVLLNLITNAFHAVSASFPPKGEMPYTPTVTVKTELWKSPLGDLGAKISITDNGPGIPDAIKDKIFQPFFTTKPTGQGTGLGLSLSYDIVKAHNGELTVETKEGEGTTFTITLPINK